MLRTCGTSGAVHSLEVRKGPIRKAGEVQSADDVEELLLDSFRLAGTNSVMLVHVALLEQVRGTGLGVSGRLTGREIPGTAPEVQRS